MNRKLKVLIACEFSGVVRREFRALGHDAYSCDLLPAEDDSPFHFQTDVRNVIDDSYDLLIGHPSCQYLCNSGVRWLWNKDGSRNEPRWTALNEATDFFLYFWNAPIKHICLENPIMHKYAKERIGIKQSCIVQPWMFGDKENKATCLWMKNLPSLIPTNNVKEEMKNLSYKEKNKIHLMPPSPHRWKERSRTFPGIGKALATQFSSYIGHHCCDFKVKYNVTQLHSDKYLKYDK